MTYKIKIDKEKCMGCGACTTCDNFEIGDDGKAFPIKSEVDEIGCNKEAEEICPVNIIKITEEN